MDSQKHNLNYINILLKSLFFIGLFIIFTAALMRFGVYEKKLLLNGPFDKESGSENNYALNLKLQKYIPIKYLLSSCGDSLLKPRQSQIELSVNGSLLTSAHSLHVDIRSKGDGLFSHWGDTILFSLPQGFENNDKVSLGIRFPIFLNPTLVNAALLLCVGSGTLLLCRLRKVSSITYDQLIGCVLKIAGIFFKWIFVIGLICSIFFLGSCIAGFILGYFLPNTAFFRWMPSLNWLAIHEPYFGHVLLLLALIGCSVEWLGLTTGKSRTAFIGVENRLALGFQRYGLVFLIALYFYSVGATWSGIPRVQDLGGSAVAGLVPFSDAKGHFEQVYHQVFSGDWQSFIARRPFAAAFRAVLVAAVNFNNYYFLMLQTLLLALATFFATREMIKWRGIWAGLSFMGLIFILTRPYLPTNLTEPLGIFWALLSIPFFIRAFQSERITEKAIAFQLTLWALLTRMGSMFTLPFLGIWIVMSQFSAGKKIIKSLSVIIGIIFINILFLKGMSYLYMNKEGSVGSNFSYTICGLVHGTDWSGPSRIYPEVNSMSSEKEQAAFLYRMALKKFLEEPGVFFLRLLEGEGVFLILIWKKILSGYTGDIPHFFPSILWWIAVMCGLGRLARNWRFSREGGFWILFVSSLLLSAPFVIFDDGWRVLSASFPLLAVLFASGFASPNSCSNFIYRAANDRLPVKWFFLLSILSLACLIVPFVIYKMDLLDARSLSKIDLQQDQVLVLGTSRMSGFLVVPDGGALPTNVPSIYHSDYTQIVKNSGIESYESLVSPIPLDRPPFAIVSTISIHPYKTSGLMIVPAEVFASINDSPWIFHVKKGSYWNRVYKAERLEK
jgi:hypothetical protein